MIEIGENTISADDVIEYGDPELAGYVNKTAAELEALESSESSINDSSVVIVNDGSSWCKKGISYLWAYIQSKLNTNQPSYVGMIIHSTTLSSLEDVQNIYGASTNWLQHDGYILRAATSGVTANRAVKDGGEDTHKLTAAESGLPAHGHGFTQPTVNGGGITNGISGGGHSHSLSNNTNIWRNTGGGNNIASGSSTNRSQVTISISGDGSHTHTLPSHTHSVSGGAVHNNSGAAASTAHNNMQCYKNVYIWERIG